MRIIVDQGKGEVIDRWAGLSSDQPSETSAALKDFWVDLHVKLYLPNPYSVLLVGLLGLATMFAVISGVVIHRHLLGDVFVVLREDSCVSTVLQAFNRKLVPVVEVATVE